MEENQKILFEGEITYTLQAIKEHLNYSMYFRVFFKIIHIVFSLNLISSLSSIVFAGYFPFNSLFITVFILVCRFGFGAKTIYNRMLSNNQGIAVHQIYHFGDSYIHTGNTYTGNQNKYQYSQIVGLAQTKHYFVLLVTHNQYMLLEKSTITGGTTDDFVRFLCENSPNLKPKKLRSNTFGKIAYYTLLILTGLSVICFLLYNILSWFIY